MTFSDLNPKFIFFSPVRSALIGRDELAEHVDHAIIALDGRAPVGGDCLVEELNPVLGGDTLRVVRGSSRRTRCRRRSISSRCPSARRASSSVVSMLTQQPYSLVSGPAEAFPRGGHGQIEETHSGWSTNGLRLCCQVS